MRGLCWEWHHRQSITQFQRRFEAASFGIAQTAHPRQLRHVETKQTPQLAMLGPQPLRDVGDGFPADAGVRNGSFRCLALYRR
jgi:hypothetical protein